MRGGHVFVVLLASALAIEDYERDALGAPGPTRANLRGRGLKFGHSVTDVTETETDAPAPAPTLAPEPFYETLDCASCPDCEVITISSPLEDNTYDFSSYPGQCICYVGTIDLPENSADFEAKIYGTEGNDCIAIAGSAEDGAEGAFNNMDPGPGQAGGSLIVFGEGGDDTILLPDYYYTGINGGDGDDFCYRGPEGEYNIYQCERTF